MNDDEFEKKLLALTGALHRPDPTPAWKADILSRARREADAIPIRRALPPRWLIAAWAAVWVAILTLNVTTPKEATPSVTSNLASSEGRAHSVSQDMPGSPQTLLALQRSMNLRLKFP